MALQPKKKVFIALHVDSDTSCSGPDLNNLWNDCRSYAENPEHWVFYEAEEIKVEFKVTKVSTPVKVK